MQEKVIQLTGLVTNKNELNYEGSLEDCENIILNKEGTISSRKGVEIYRGDNNIKADRLFVLNNNIYKLGVNKKVYNVTQNIDCHDQYITNIPKSNVRDINCVGFGENYLFNSDKSIIRLTNDNKIKSYILPKPVAPFALYGGMYEDSVKNNSWVIYCRICYRLKDYPYYRSAPSEAIPIFNKDNNTVYNEVLRTRVLFTLGIHFYNLSEDLYDKVVVEIYLTKKQYYTTEIGSDEEYYLFDQINLSPDDKIFKIKFVRYNFITRDITDAYTETLYCSPSQEGFTNINQPIPPCNLISKYKQYLFAGDIYNKYITSSSKVEVLIDEDNFSEYQLSILDGTNEIINVETTSKLNPIPNTYPTLQPITLYSDTSFNIFGTNISFYPVNVFSKIAVYGANSLQQLQLDNTKFILGINTSSVFYIGFGDTYYFTSIVQSPIVLFEDSVNNRLYGTILETLSIRGDITSNSGMYVNSKIILTTYYFYNMDGSNVTNYIEFNQSNITIDIGSYGITINLSNKKCKRIGDFTTCLVKFELLSGSSFGLTHNKFYEASVGEFSDEFVSLRMYFYNLDRISPSATMGMQKELNTVTSGSYRLTFYHFLYNGNISLEGETGNYKFKYLGVYYYTRQTTTSDVQAQISNIQIGVTYFPLYMYPNEKVYISNSASYNNALIYNNNSVTKKYLLNNILNDNVNAVDYLKSLRGYNIIGYNTSNDQKCFIFEGDKKYKLKVISNNTSTMEKYFDTMWDKNIVIYSKDNIPEYHGLLNYFIVGEKLKSVIGMASVHDYLLLFKEDGIFRISGMSKENFVLDKINDTLILESKETIANFQDQVYFLSNSGVYRTDGARFEHIGLPIFNLIKEVLVNNTTTKRHYAYVNYKDKTYNLFLEEQGGNGYTSVVYIYYIEYDKWVKHKILQGELNQGLLSAAYDDSKGIIYYEPYSSSGIYGNIYKTRNLETDLDYLDEMHTFTVSSVSGNNIIVNENVTTDLIDGILSLNTNCNNFSYITNIDKINKKITIDKVRFTINSGATIYCFKPINNVIHTSYNYLSSMAMLKKIEKILFTFKRGDIYKINLDVITDVLRTTFSEIKSEEFKNNYLKIDGYNYPVDFLKNKVFCLIKDAKVANYIKYIATIKSPKGFWELLFNIFLFENIDYKTFDRG